MVRAHHCPPNRSLHTSHGRAKGGPYADLTQNGYCSGPENRCPQGHGGSSPPVGASSIAQWRNAAASMVAKWSPNKTRRGVLRCRFRTGDDFRTATRSVARKVRDELAKLRSAATSRGIDTSTLRQTRQAISIVVTILYRKVFLLPRTWKRSSVGRAPGR